MNNAQNKAIMNNVTTTRIYSGTYTINVETAEGNTFLFRLENVKGMTDTSDGFIWNITEENDKVDLCCAAWHQTKREAVNFLKRNRLEDNLVKDKQYRYDY